MMDHYNQNIEHSLIKEGFIQSMINAFVDSIEKKRWKNYDEYRNSKEYKDAEKKYKDSVKKLKDHMKQTGQDVLGDPDMKRFLNRFRDDVEDLV